MGKRLCKTVRIAAEVWSGRGSSSETPAFGDTLLLHADVAASFMKQDVEAQLLSCAVLAF